MPGVPRNLSFSRQRLAVEQLGFTTSGLPRASVVIFIHAFLANE